MPERYRMLFALLYGTGLDLSTALLLRRRDVDLERRELRARGTKTHNRDRVAGVAEWAWPLIAPHLKTMLPDAPLFPGANRYTPSAVHRDTLKALKLPRLTLHDARHHWAVRMVRAGAPLELVARQLGHKDGTLCLKVYGRFVPTTEERQRWDAEASRMEALR